jgi:AAA+ superfamily predicted ATPase
MILTTNRMRSLDSAFESRIDISLTYNPLNTTERCQVWKNFIGNFSTKDVDIDSDAIMELAQWEFNGRQIKSAIKTARILAAKQQEPLRKKHLDVVLRLRDKALKMMQSDDVDEHVRQPIPAPVKGTRTNGIGPVSSSHY